MKSAADRRGGVKTLTRIGQKRESGQCCTFRRRDTAPLREKQADGSWHPFDAFIISKTPAGRWGTTDDLIGPAVFLASDAGNFVNGHILYVDGGILAYIGKQP